MMWIAKPLRSLSTQEKSAWQSLEPQFPLAQTLAWGSAIEAVAGKVFVVFNPEERVGGLVFKGQENLGFFECVNGPHLAWDDPIAAPRQLATFAMAVSRLTKNFRSLCLRPRWLIGEIEKRVPLLPVPLYHQTQAATWIIPLKKTAEEQFSALSKRMRRTLRRAGASGVETRWEKITPSLLISFVSALKGFSLAHHFTIPPLTWFEVLTQSSNSPHLSFWIVTAEKRNQLDENFPVAISQLLVCIHGETAHYLFGYERRTPDLKSSLSVSASAHWEALKRCLDAGLKNYDLNGYILDVQANDPYAGVCQFKEQFSGHALRYDIPEFLIQSGL